MVSESEPNGLVANGVLLKQLTSIATVQHMMF